MTQQDAYDALVEAAEDFVDKVETGRARSKDSYQKFKRALALLDGDADEKEKEKSNDRPT